MVRVDRADGARKDRQQLRKRTIDGVCPEREDAKKARLKKGRQVVENNINRFKDFRALATRYQTRGHPFFAAVHVACSVLWL
ncbi:hypothetical protein GCM10008957_34780 [Deinococcus ruber]|uniref:Transposase n=1 Tax=Deinococcus ruber TaxID=1848197 RepID=A0A918F9V9_9DEIO|nr:hypothetical protein GCM10008957_34780 [Deinococcus ruber]